ncbi:NTP transferase domain-containing protein [Candidatus Woesearchaeota archaeon]|nr:NTP transferase domain-containing protein [Candidatus Woesearchaeota archaeon]
MTGKIVILAAGKGTRMRPITEEVPKALIEVAGKPFLHWLLRTIQKAGYDDIGIVVGYKKEMISEFLEEEGFEATLIEQKEQKGTGHAVFQAEDFAGGKDFVVVMGDNLYSRCDLSGINKDDSYCYVAGYEHDDPSRFGVLVVEEGKLVRIHEKPKEFVGRLINTGLYKFTSEIFEVLKNIKLSERGEYELTDAINILAEQGKVKVLRLADFWKDFGKIDDIEEVNNFLEGKCAV